MKIYVSASPTFPVINWLQRYATELMVVALVVLATLGVGVAQARYSNAAPQATVVLDQHERHLNAH
jgi:hypothetical protein